MNGFLMLNFRVMELDLEHLAGYLPYGLKCHNMGNTDDEGNPIVQEIIGLDLDGVIVSCEHEDEHYIFSDTFPILRPLSDMTKEINYGLSSYIFIELFEISDTEGFIYEFDSGNIKLLKQIASISKNNSVHDINYLPYPVVQMMLEYHFDIHGLIEQNLAIDINTL